MGYSMSLVTIKVINLMYILIEKMDYFNAEILKTKSQLDYKIDEILINLLKNCYLKANKAIKRSILLNIN